MEEQEPIGESERWISGIAGAMLVLSSLRRRDLGAGALFAATGSALLYRGLMGRGGFFSAVGGYVSRELFPAVEDDFDEVEEASAESFPASDPPSFTPTSGTEPAAES